MFYITGIEIHDSGLLEKAKLEDVLMELLYSEYKSLVFHGGTAIWRCYSGNRYSRDLDFYYKAGSKSKSECYKMFIKFFKDRGFSVKNSSYNHLSDTMQFLLESNVKMKVDINFGYKAGVPTEYLKVDGSRIVVLALTQEEILDEKIGAYFDKLHNQSKIKQPEAQDLYDISYLVTLIKRKNPQTLERAQKLIAEIRDNPPPNMRSLGSVILAGLPPTFDMMLETIRKWCE